MLATENSCNIMRQNTIFHQILEHHKGFYASMPKNDEVGRYIEGCRGMVVYEKTK